jgi:predicted dehydrogenase
MEGSASAARSGRQKQLRLGVIGLGAVAQAVHLPLLAKHHEQLRIAAICDLSPSIRAAVGDELGLPAERRFGNGLDLIDAGGLDAVAILSSGSHGELALAAARAGLPIFCEKPLSYTLEEADLLAEAEPRLMLGYMKLFDPAVERAQALLAKRPTPRSIEVTVLHPPSAPQLAHAKLLPAPADIDPETLAELRAAEAELLERALGQVSPELAHLYVEVLLGSIVHDLSVVRFLAGGPLRITHGESWGAPDAPSIALLGELPNGPHVSIRWHYLEGYPAYREEVRVHDDLGSVALTFPAPYLLHAPTTLTVVDARDEAERVARFRSTVEAFEEQWLAFAGFAAGGHGARAGVREGRDDIVVCQDAVRALPAKRASSEPVLTGDAT